MAKMQKKDLSRPDEKRTFDKGQVELVSLGGVKFGRATLQPQGLCETRQLDAPEVALASNFGAGALFTDIVLLGKERP